MDELAGTNLTDVTVRGFTARLTLAVIFACFFVSGFCSLLYQVLWTRLAFAHFGIITPVLSLIVSVFMLGLGIGSAYGGRLAKFAEQKFNISPLYLYAAAETSIGIGAFAVPAIFDLCEPLLLRTGGTSSITFLVVSAICIVIALLPWCVAMGATIPLMMAFARRREQSNSQSFSFLYAANVLGAATGATATALVFIEMFGLRGTWTLGALGNLTIAVLAIALAAASSSAKSESRAAREEAGSKRTAVPTWVSPVLFITGFSCVGMEVCWARDFTFQLLTTIYAFATILATYLISTFAGSAYYRNATSRGVPFSAEALIAWLFPLSLLPILLADPRVDHSALQTLLSIVPLCSLLGFLTPGLIDRFGRGDATRAGRFYALNIIGGILGPLVAGYFLLPLLGIRWTMIALALPFFAALFLANRSTLRKCGPALAASAFMTVTAIFFSRAYDDGSIYATRSEVHRDYAASVVAYGAGPSAQLLVNAIPITVLTTDTKIMAHLPLALLKHPQNALDICFGMGTTFRSLSTWGIDTTAVDLSPSVIQSFGFFHADANTILANPHNHTVADDGRRYLMRTGRKFDVITLDPPPPAEASGSSLLYSIQFYDVAKRRLAPRGILAQWLPLSEPRIGQSVALALHRSFPYVRAFRAQYGTHLIASMVPLVIPSPDEFVKRMPPSAQRDLIEWEGDKTAQAIIKDMLKHEVPLDSLLPSPGAGIPALSDDRPYNEYFFLRRTGLID